MYSSLGCNSFILLFKKKSKDAFGKIFHFRIALGQETLSIWVDMPLLTRQCGRCGQHDMDESQSCKMKFMLKYHFFIKSVVR
jgi:hypothetical protein